MKKINNSSTSKALFKNTGIIAIGQVSTKIVNFLLLPLYTALLTTEEYGLVDLLTTYASLIAVVIGLQMSQAVFRFLVTCRDDEHRLREISSTVILETIVIFVGYIIVFLLVHPFITIDYKWFLLIYVLASIFLQTAAGIARGLGNNTVYAAGNFISAFVMIVLNILFVAIMRLGVSAMLVSQIVGPLIGGTYIFVCTRIWKYFDIKAANKKDMKMVMNYAIPLVPNELSWTVIHSSDRMIISTFVSIAANGLIAVAAKISTIYTTFFSIFNTSWTEQVVLHYKDEGGPEYVCEMFDKMITFFASIAIGIIVCIPLIFTIIVNESFTEAYGLIPWYMIAVFFNAVIGMISAIYLVENETKQVAFSTMAAAVINVVVDFALVNQIGMYAAPISSICGYMAISFWRLWDVNKRHCRITMSRKKLLLLIVMLATAIASYYSRKIWAEVAGLIFVAAVALALNYRFLMEFAGMFRKERGESK